MIELKNLSLSLGKFSFDKVNLTIGSSEFFVILGPTGSGKTVLLESIAGLKPIKSGAIFINGQDVTSLPPEERHISICYQDLALFPHMNVKENICYGLRFRNKPHQTEAMNNLEELVELLKISNIMERKPKNLSGGEKQRVALARALIVKPDVLLLDEPLSALDASIKENIESELKKIHRVLRPTTIMVTHDFREAYHLATSIGVIKNGVILQTGTVSDIFEKPTSLAVANFVGMKNIIPLSFIKENYKNTKGTIAQTELNKDFFGVRPEKIKVGCLPQEKDFVMSGTIARIKNAGVYLQIDISYDKYSFQVILTPNYCDGLTLSEGAKIIFGFNYNDICFLS